MTTLDSLNTELARIGHIDDLELLQIRRNECYLRLNLADNPVYAIMNRIIDHNVSKPVQKWPSLYTVSIGPRMKSEAYLECFDQQRIVRRDAKGRFIK